ncbi:MAG: hypothetical protein AAF639_15215 [Chloroflexota bacterium]
MQESNHEQMSVNLGIQEPHPNPNLGGDNHTGNRPSNHTDMGSLSSQSGQIQSGYQHNQIQGSFATSTNQVMMQSQPEEAGESPDLIRWRADLLMDEMMLGGVDISAVASAPGSAIETGNFSSMSQLHPASLPHASNHNGQTHYTNGNHQNGNQQNSGYQNGHYQNGNGASHERSVPNGFIPPNTNPASIKVSDAPIQNNHTAHHSVAESATPISNLSAQFSAAVAAYQTSPTNNPTQPAYATDQASVYQTSPPVSPAQQPTQPQFRPQHTQTPNPQPPSAGANGQGNPWLFSAAERYQQNGYAQPTPNNQTANHYVDPNSLSQNSQRPQPQNLNGQGGYTPISTQFDRRPTAADAFQGNPRQTYDSQMINEPASAMRYGYDSIHGYGADSYGTDGYATDRYVDEDNEASANTMRNGPRVSKYSTLLPRMNKLNVRAVQKEMSELGKEIEQLTQKGYVMGNRATHLLEKAQAIVENDPERSAEVEYYMQQVRAIVGRAHHAYQGSQTYAKSLFRYLWGWFFLSVLVISARYLYGGQIEQILSSIAALASDGFILQHLTSFNVAIFAGTLGSAIGALYNIRTHRRQNNGIFDHKYSMRVLILPIIGAIIGVILYLPFGAGYAFTSINPATSLLPSTIPAVCTFLLGMSQEALFGTSRV